MAGVAGVAHLATDAYRTKHLTGGAQYATIDDVQITVTPRFATCLPLLGILLFARPVLGDPCALPASKQARRHLKVGNKLLGIRSFELAIASYKKGYVIEPKPVFLHNLALAYRLKGDYRVAIDYYRNFLSRAHPPAHIRKPIENLISQMQAELDQAARKRPPTEPEPRNQPPRRNPKPEEPPMHQAPWYSDGIGWGLSGSGLLVGGVGVAILANAASLRDDARRELSASRRDVLNSQADTRQTWGMVLGLVGAATLGVGILKLVLHSDTKHCPSIHPTRQRLSAFLMS